jgi:hypothetical protein
LLLKLKFGSCSIFEMYFFYFYGKGSKMSKFCRSINLLIHDDKHVIEHRYNRQKGRLYHILKYFENSFVNYLQLNIIIFKKMELIPAVIG